VSQQYQSWRYSVGVGVSVGVDLSKDSVQIAGSEPNRANLQ
jgi:hypothetical protein